MNSEFWRNETQRLCNRLVERCLQGRERVTFGDICDRGFPEIFIFTTKLHLDRIFENEPAVELSNSARYDFDNAAFRESAEAFREQVFDRMLVDRDELRKLAEAGIQLELDILIQPLSKLLTLLFKKDTAIRREDAMTIIRGFGERRAFVERLVTLLKNYDESFVPKDELTRLCNKAELAVYRETPVSAFLNEITLYLDFENAITGEEQSLVRSEILLEMLASRRLQQMLTDIETEASDKDYWTLTEIENALERHLLVGSLEKPGDAPTAGEREKHEFDIGGFRLEARKRATRRHKQDLESLQFNFLDDELDYDGAPPPTDEQTDDLIEVLSRSASNGGEKKEHGTTVEEAVPQQNAAAVGDVSPADLDWLQVRVFENSKDECHAFVARVVQMEDWLDAKATIDKEIEQRGFRPDGEEAGRLEEVLFGNFFRGKRWSHE